MLVFAVHTYPGIFPGGIIGVDIFFVISGFLITSLLLREVERSGRISLSGFYRRRALRILPASLFCTLVVYFLANQLIAGNEPADLIAFASAFSFMNWLRAFTDLTGRALGHYWSLAIEEQFYAIWSVLLLALVSAGRLRLMTWMAGALWISSMLWRVYLNVDGVDPDRIYNGLDTHVDGLLIGCILAATTQISFLKMVSRFWMLAALFVCVAVVWFDGDSELLCLTLPAASLVSGWMVICVLNSETPLARFLSTDIATALGRRSYSFYLWHFPIVIAFYSSPYPRSLWIIPCFVLCCAVAELSYRYVETPFLKLKDRPRRALVA